jgi:hypothetical protein
MIEYVYIVKCPNCEDEHFNFFDEAKEYATSLLSKKPIITQTEVHRNDFGECTDHYDLGTIWTWEAIMSDVADEPVDNSESVFSKADTFEDNDCALDQEFASLDNSVECDPRMPIPEGMTVEQLVEEMEENEDTVECTWCEELFDKSECRKEVDLGWLCSRCEMAIKSRGETLTFREGNYWDFLDEKLEESEETPDVNKQPVPAHVDILADDTVLITFSDLTTYDGEQWVYETTADEAVDYVIDYITDDDIADLTEGRFMTYDDFWEYIQQNGMDLWSQFIESNAAELVDRHKLELLDEIRATAEEECNKEYESAEQEASGETFDGFRDYDDFARWRNS